MAWLTWTSIISIPLLGIASIFFSLLGLLVIALGCICRNTIALARLEWFSLMISVAAIVAWSTTTLFFSPAYGTDEIAFAQYAAQLLSHGINPYTQDLAPAFDQFHVPIKYATYTMNGGVSSGLAYPDFSFLFITPLLILGITSQAAIIVNVAFLILSMILGFLLFPVSWRLLSVILCIGIPTLFSFTVGGVNDVIYMPFLMVSAFGWDRYHTRRGWWALLIPAAFGMACSVKQLPWFISPFLITGIFLEARADTSVNNACRLCARYIVIAVGSFVLVNLPFILWNPRAWLQGIVLPITQHAIPYGQGLVDLSIYFHIGGGRVDLYTDASLLLMGGLWVLYIGYYRYLRYATFLLPPLFLFFASRSLAGYFTVLILAGVMGAFTLKEYRGAQIKVPRWLTPVVFLPAVGLLLVALGTPAPLNVRIASFRTNGQLGAVQQLRVVVRNNSNQALGPHFATNSSGQMTTFWNIAGGPTTLGPHQAAVYTLIAPNLDSMPPVATAFQVQIVTPSPATISSSNIIIPEQTAAYLTPGYIDHPVHLGQTVHFDVQLRDHYGADVHQSGIPISLGQIIYGQDSLVDGESKINSGNVGQTPVGALTDRNGVAHFSITDTSLQADPIYYEAWIAQQDTYPYGYSNTVIVNWVI
jgi:uncharacterized membrane protein